MKSTKKSSPIPKKPLRRPGQSLQKKLIDSYILPVYFLGVPPVLCIGVLIGGWKTLSQHWFGIIFFLFNLGIYELIAYFLYVRFAKKKIERIKLGYEGEVYVGQQLDEMRSYGWLVLHDFQTGKGNIDHIIIAPQGIFTVETKSVSQFDDESTIYYDCENVQTDKRKLTSPLTQARAEANFLSSYLKEKLTMNVSVQPIVNYPGWKYEYRGRKTLDECEVWICLTAGLPKVINSRPRQLSSEDVARIYNFLASENRV